MEAQTLYILKCITWVAHTLLQKHRKYVQISPEATAATLPPDTVPITDMDISFKNTHPTALKQIVHPQPPVKQSFKRITQGTGYFRWIIATDTTVLWEGLGQAQGNSDLIDPLLTKGIAYLSLLRFLLRYCIYHDTSIQPDTALHYCNNLTQIG
eukprot:15365731-Ditylum_brightwellii.AAC.3